MALIICPDCNSEVSDRAPACPKCGGPIAVAPPTAPVEQRDGVNCPHCHTFIPAGAQRCTGCQARYGYVYGMNPVKRMIVCAIVLVPIAYFLMQQINAEKAAFGWVCFLIPFCIGLGIIFLHALRQHQKGPGWWR